MVRYTNEKCITCCVFFRIKSHGCGERKKQSYLNIKEKEKKNENEEKKKGKENDEKLKCMRVLRFDFNTKITTLIKSC